MKLDGLKKEIDALFSSLSERDVLPEKEITAVLARVREALKLDAVYVAESAGGRRFFCSAAAVRDPERPLSGKTVFLTEEELRALASEDGELLHASKDGGATSLESELRFGFRGEEGVWGFLGLRPGERRVWTEEERSLLARLGRGVRLWLGDCRNAAGEEAEMRRLASAVGDFCRDVLLVSLWEDAFEPVRTSPRFQEAITADSYSAMVAQFTDTFVEPQFQPELYYWLSSECVCSQLSPQNLCYHMDFRCVEDGFPSLLRIHMVLVDMTGEGLPNRVLFAVQDITTRVRERDLNDIAFTLIEEAYARIAFVDLSAGSLTTIHAGRGDPIPKGSVIPYKDALEKIAEETVLPEYREEMLSMLSPGSLHQMFNSGVPSVELTYRHRAEGRTVWARSELIPLKDYTPDNARVMWYVREVNEDQSRLDAHLREVLRANASLNAALRLERQYRLALTADSYLHFTFDVSGDGFLLEDNVSQGGLEIVRAFTGMEMPMPVETFFKEWRRRCMPVFTREMEEDVFTIPYLKSVFLRNERIINLEVKQTPPAGSGIPEFFEIFIILSENEVTGHIMAIVIWKDISKLRGVELQARIALRDAYQVAEEASRAKSEFLSRMSHDIRTPMNAIIGMTAIAKAHLGDSDRVSDCLDKINASSRHLLSLVNEVLDMSKIESGKVDLTEEPFSLSDLIDNLSLLVRPQIAAKKHRFNIQLNDVRHEKVIGDSLRIRQVFVNLMSNAVKYTPDGGKIDLIITEKPSRQHQFGCFEFVFQDNGIGMSPDFVKRIFEPFSRAEDTRVNKIQGTGLGMAIARNLVRMMSGDIQVESELGRGSKFTVTVFLRLQETDEPQTEEFRGLSVLVVDGDEAAIHTAGGILRELGMKPECVVDAQSALDLAEAASREGRDLLAVILDWKMPGLDGAAFIRELKQRTEKMPAVIASAYDWSDIEQEARAAGVGGFISKPLFKSRFIQLFRSILGDASERADTESVLGVEEGAFAGKRVLLCEDNALNAEIAVEILNMAGIEVEQAENGREAVEAFNRAAPGRYDLIFMDIQMPVMNGYEATQAIRALPRPDAAQIPIVAMTANAFTEDVEASFRSGMNGHIAKPLDFGQLTETLKKFLS